MANFMYPNAKRLMLTGALDWTSDPIVAVLLTSAGYTPSVNHTCLLDVPAAARVAASNVLTGKTVVANVVDADDYLYTSLSGPTVGAILLAVNSGSEATSWLLCYLDSNLAGLPLTPDGGDMQLVWDNGPSKIFAL